MKYFIIKDDEGSCTILGEIEREVSKEEYDSWAGKKRTEAMEQYASQYQPSAAHTVKERKHTEQSPDLAWQIATLAVMAATNHGKGDNIIDVDAAINTVREYLSKPHVSKQVLNIAHTRQGKDMIIKGDNICPVTQLKCDDECCPIGAVCNLSSDVIKDIASDPIEKCACSVPISQHGTACGWQNAKIVTFPWEASILSSMTGHEIQLRYILRNESEETVKLNLGQTSYNGAEVLPPCVCQACNKAYAYDLTVPDELWAVISPRKMDGWKSGGLLCPECIIIKVIEFYTSCIGKILPPDGFSPSNQEINTAAGNHAHDYEIRNPSAHPKTCSFNVFVYGAKWVVSNLRSEADILKIFPPDLYPYITNLEGKLQSVFQYIKGLENKCKEYCQHDFVKKCIDLTTFYQCSKCGYFHY